MHANTWSQRAGWMAALFATAFVLIAATITAAAADGNGAIGMRGRSGGPASSDIRISLDQAFPVRLGAPAEGVAIGNPAIAGVSVQNDQLIFVTGRSYGTTNLVVVGADGRLLYSGRVTVTPDETGTVMVTRGIETSRLECSPLCRPRGDIGSPTAVTQALNEQMSSRASAAEDQ